MPVPKSPKEREPDPSLDSERESFATHKRRMAREAKQAEPWRDPRDEG